ncbi:MAG: hypothetical protein JWM41_2866 [Gemmatimonadetes bacterium]|nr:hypothetical protein [Gemmatimonadota bacterium]
MTRRHAHHAERFVADRGTDELPMFARPNKAEKRAELKQLQARLEPHIIAMAANAGAEGIIASEVIAAAIADWGTWTGQEWRSNPRAYSMVGPFLAVLARRGVLAPKRVQGYHVSRKAERDNSHGNNNLIYVDLRYA